MPSDFPCKDHLPALQSDDAKRVVEVLGPMPREALTAMVDYGLSDVELSSYYSLSTITILSLRQHFGITGDWHAG